VCKNEIKKLKGDLDASERGRFVLSEKIANLEAVPPIADTGYTDEASNALKEENESLKKELSEAKASLEEVYKALS
jgi:hypothetical protein